MWLARARDFVGLREIAGPLHDTKILQFARDAHVGWIRDDETAWCATFVCAMLERSLITSPRSASARSFENWGIDIMDHGHGIPLGAIVVYDRPPNPAHGHVGFAVGIDADGNIHTLGGNQANSVSIAPFKPARHIATRWPSEYKQDLKLLRRIPFISTRKPVSTNEA
jgi:uncharacterized protein (TIGR02594 family)